jgi:hypothetical protein
MEQVVRIEEEVKNLNEETVEVQEPQGINAQNIWKITPVNIALLKNHTGCIKRFLMEPDIEINGKDDKGRTLLHMSLIRIDDYTLEFVKLLVEKGADLNI